MSERVNPFGDLDDFAPAPKAQTAKAVQKEAVDQVAADNGFPSRQPAKVEAEAKSATRPQRRYTTGRNQQINLKAKAETIEQMHRIADQLGVPLGEVLARALDALEKEIR